MEAVAQLFFRLVLALGALAWARRQRIGVGARLIRDALGRAGEHLEWASVRNEP